MVVVVFVEHGGHGGTSRPRRWRRSSSRRASAKDDAGSSPALRGRRSRYVQASQPVARGPPVIGRAARRPAAARLDRPRLGPGALRARDALRLLGDGGEPPRGAGRAAGDLGRRRGCGISFGRPLGLPDAPEGLLRHLLRALVPLVYLLFFGERIANVSPGSAFGGLQFQPAELAKIATALLLAYLFENEDDGRLRLSDLLQARRHRPRAVLARLPAARPGPRADVSSAPVRRACTSAACRRGGGSSSP